MTLRSIYLDYAATTPVDERVLLKMQECLSFEGDFGNPSATHELGLRAKTRIQEAREQVATLLQIEPRCLLWTSGATEANNLAIQGVAYYYQDQGKHIVTSETEHSSVLDTCRFLEKQGFEVTYLKPASTGLIDLNTFQAALRKDTILASILQVNNETGVIQDIEAMGKLTRERGIFFHVDAVQSLGKLPINLKVLPVDLMSFSAHKIYGPKGIGALYIGNWPKVRLQPILYGGGQERNLRPGTLPTHQIVGMGEACQIMKQEMQVEMSRIQELGDILWQGIQDLKGVSLNGHPQYRIGGILNVCFNLMERESLLSRFNALAFSKSSACHAATEEPSSVLRAMGLQDEAADRSIRFSIGRYTTKQDIEQAIQIIRGSYP